MTMEEKNSRTVLSRTFSLPNPSHVNAHSLSALYEQAIGPHDPHKIKGLYVHQRAQISPTNIGTNSVLLTAEKKAKLFLHSTKSIGSIRTFAPLQVKINDRTSNQLSESPVKTTVNNSTSVIDEDDTVESRRKWIQTTEDEVLQTCPDVYTNKNYRFHSFHKADKDDHSVSVCPFADPKLEMDVLMIGKTYNGKSALGNSIPEYNEPSSSLGSINVQKELNEYKGTILRVFRIPGVDDSYLNTEIDKSHLVESLSNAISINETGFHALLLVFRLGEKFTQEMRITIEVLKQIFGKHVIAKFCILFIIPVDSTQCPFTIEEWIEEEKGDMADLVKECNKRFVLFDNRTNDKEKKDDQMKRLLDLVQDRIFRNCRITTKQLHLDKRRPKDLTILLEKQNCLPSLKMPSKSMEYMETYSKKRENSIDNDLQFFHVCPELQEILSTRNFTSGLPLPISGDILDCSLKGVVELNQTENALYFYLESRSVGAKVSDTSLTFSASLYNPVTELYLPIGESVFIIKDTQKSTSERLSFLAEKVQRFIQNNQLVIAWTVQLTSKSKNTSNIKQEDITVNDNLVHIEDDKLIKTCLINPSDTKLNQETKKESLDEVSEIIEHCQKQVMLNKAGIELLKTNLSAMESRMTNLFSEVNTQDITFSTGTGLQPDGSICLPQTPDFFNSNVYRKSEKSFIKADYMKTIESFDKISCQKRFLYEVPVIEIDLLLIGKTGQGKSALGNSLLGRRHFESAHSACAVTMSVQDELVYYKGKGIKVVDTPGVEDSDDDKEQAKNMIVESLSSAITINLTGYHAFLLVVKFGEKITRENYIIVEVLKSIFGENFVKNFCVLVITFGDLFEGGNSFREWLNEQKRGMLNLAQECGNRVILFNNKAKEKETRVDALLDIVLMLVLKNGRYTSEDFTLTRLSRDDLSIEPMKLLIEEECMKEANLILERLRFLQVDTEHLDGPIKYVPTLDQLNAQTFALLEKLREQDRDTGVLSDLISHVRSLQSSIDDEKRLVFRISQLINRVSPDCKTLLTSRIRRKRNEFYSNLLDDKSFQSTVDKVTAKPDAQLSGDDVKQINTMDELWGKTKKLNSDLNVIKARKKQTILGAFQNKVLWLLKRNLKDGRRNFELTDCKY